MSRRVSWKMLPGEELPVAVSLAHKLAPGETLTGTPTGAIYSESGGSYTVASTGSVAAMSRNSSALTASDGTTIAINEGVTFMLTAPDAAGTYYVRVDCASTDGSDPGRQVTLIVDGSPDTN